MALHFIQTHKARQAKQEFDGFAARMSDLCVKMTMECRTRISMKYVNK